MGEIVTRERDPWSQQSDETAADYAAFTEFCRLGSRRTFRLLAANLGMPVDRARRMFKAYSWNERAEAYDAACNELVPTGDISIEETMAFQYMVGKMMLDVGIRALELKNPATMRTGDIVKLLHQGAEIQRRAAGVTDTVNIKVESDAVRNINRLLDDIGMFEAEVVEEEDDE